MGTVPIGTGEDATIASLISSIPPPVERSITVSEPKWTAWWSFSSSWSTLEWMDELPMFALILQRALMPMPIGSRLAWLTLAGVTMRPRAISDRIASRSGFSGSATPLISAVTTGVGVGPAGGLGDTGAVGTSVDPGGSGDASFAASGNGVWWMAPASMVCPVRLTAWKYMSTPSISTSMNE